MSQSNKQLFAPHSGIYLQSHSVGLPPAQIKEIWEKDFLAAWKMAGETAWPEWLEVINKFRAKLGSFLNKGARCI